LHFGQRIFFPAAESGTASVAEHEVHRTVIFSDIAGKSSTHQIRNSGDVPGGMEFAILNLTVTFYHGKPLHILSASKTGIPIQIPTARVCRPE
jgi:hypothetical protein